MLLSTEKNFLFIHIPKTGGSSINHLLNPYRNFDYMTNSHLTIENYRNWVDTELFNKLFKFTFIRNPWDLQVSTWRYSVKNHGLTISFKDYIKWKFIDDTNLLDYKKFANSSEDDKNEDLIRSAFYINRVPQIYFIISERGQIMVDYIGNLENIEKDIENICSTLDIDYQFIPKINVSNHENKPYQEYYDDETRQIIQEWFKLDIEIFKYDFHENKPTSLISPKNKQITDLVSKFNKTIVFNIATIIYGFGDFKRKFENDADYIKQKKEFDMDRHLRSIEMYKINLEVIKEKINKLKIDISLNNDDKDSIDLLQKLVLREINYMSQIINFEKLYNKYLENNE
jgi:chondroitin 4-sulfotransferase 11